MAKQVRLAEPKKVHQAHDVRRQSLNRRALQHPLAATGPPLIVRDDGAALCQTSYQVAPPGWSGALPHQKNQRFTGTRNLIVERQPMNRRLWHFISPVAPLARRISRLPPPPWSRRSPLSS